jgi:YVTN family beta-propeller protein
MAALALAGTLVGPWVVATPPLLDVHAQVPTGAMPKGVSLSPDGQRLYVANYGQLDRGNITVHDARTLRRLARFDLPGIAVETAVSTDGRTLYVSNFRRNSVQFVDTASGAVTREVTTGSHPKIVVLSPDGRRLFAANWGGQSVTELNARTGAVVRTLRVGANPRGMAISRSGTLYVANFGAHTIDVFSGPDLSRHHTLSHVCRVPRHLALSPDDRTLYVSCFTASALGVLDTATERFTRFVSVGRSPKALDVFPDGRHVVTANYGGCGATVVDTRDWTTRTLDIPAMDHASGVVAGRDGLRFYVTGWYDDHLFAVGLSGQGPRVTISAAERLRVRAQRAFHDAHPAE